jgi:hypothetical protein
MPKVPRSLKGKHYRMSRTAYHRAWREQNRLKVNAYWRRHYKQNHAERRAYLNRKQQEYRAKNVASQ